MRCNFLNRCTKSTTKPYMIKNFSALLLSFKRYMFSNTIYVGARMIFKGTIAYQGLKLTIIVFSTRARRHHATAYRYTICLIYTSEIRTCVSRHKYSLVKNIHWANRAHLWDSYPFLLSMCYLKQRHVSIHADFTPHAGTSRVCNSTAPKGATSRLKWGLE